MKSKITLTKSEQKLQVLFIVSILSSFVVIAFGIYFQNHNLDNDHVLVPLLLLCWFIPCCIYTYSGLTNGNLVKLWTSTVIYNTMIWLLIKITSNQQKAKCYTYKVIAVLIINFYLLLFFMVLQMFLSTQLKK